ncbi:hypothetical protein HRI_005289400 [Hibiscus trionum]|uniref:H(+)-transporting two-sector ATPase n=1 Tax=Hibiscus trionum TaxID=183268 RepID=A0A9W7JEQ8_HIBTR|nr:hypothetical protein HRI_003251300 [Hibiscus trionum]GMJ14106.1 hypothetical protein HRI_005079800 [Hibiscus trionum]GMJ16202.1 hypothetical protein HRI_005289400 [Hibiscus trionum]
MPQLDKLTYFSQFFWLCLFLFIFYIPICNDGDGVLGISRILKLRNQLLSHRGNNIRSKDPKSLEDILIKGLSTMYLLIVFLPLLGSFIAGFFGRFLGSGSEGTAGTPFFLFLLLLLMTLIISYRLLKKKGRNSWILLLLIYISIFILTLTLRSWLSEILASFLGMSLVLWFSSDSGDSLPPLDSSSSSESLNTFRQLYAADYEQSIFARIQSLENGQYYNIPPQTRPGEYASIVRQHFDQSISVDHLRSAMDMEYREVIIWEKKALLQDRLFSFMISEERIERILQLSPYDDVRKEAFDFLEREVEGLNDLQSEEVRRQMDERLSSILTTIRQHGRASSIYRRFYSHFIDEEFRRFHGLSLP